MLYGLTAGPLANALNLSKPNPQGVLFVGAHPIARALAQAVQREGLAVLLADTNWENLAAARLEGLPTYYGNVLSEEARDELELTGIGRLVALTPNQEVNALAAMHFIEFFGRSEVYQVQVHTQGGKKTELEPHGRLLFGAHVFLSDLSARLELGATVRRTTITSEFSFEAWKSRNVDEALPLFLLSDAAGLRLFTASDPPIPMEGQTIIALVREPVASADRPLISESPSHGHAT
jgi:hypothetical protein